MSDFLYPLDTTGVNPSNRVRGEFQTLSPPTQSDNFHFIIPKSGPYFRDSVKLIHVSTGRPLIRGIDWEPGHHFHSASYETESVQGGIYQSILFLDRTLSGQIHLEEYQVLGGTWSLDENTILEILSNKLYDPRTITYEQVSGKPEVFPPIEHMHPADDMVGMREQVEATYSISAALRERTRDIPDELRLILENYYTKSQVDLIIEELTAQLIDQVVSETMEQLVLDALESELGNIYLKDEIDDIIARINRDLADRYTKTETDNLLNRKLDADALDGELANYVRTQVFDATIQDIRDTYTTLTAFNAAIAALNQKDVSQDNVIAGLNNALTALGNSLSEYVRKDELASLIENSQPYKDLEQMMRDGDQSILNQLQETNTVLDALRLTVAQHLTGQEISDLIATELTALIDQLSPDGGDPVTLYSESGEERLVGAINIVNASGGYPISGTVTLTESCTYTSFTLEANDGPEFTIPSGTYSIVFPEEPFDPADRFVVTMVPVVNDDGAVTSWHFEITDNDLVSTDIMAVIWRLDYIEGQGMSTQVLLNPAVLESEVNHFHTVSASEMTSDSTVEFTVPLNIAHELRYEELSTVLLSPSGESLPIHNTILSVEQGTGILVSMDLPAYDLSLFPSHQRELDIQIYGEIYKVKA